MKAEARHFPSGGPMRRHVHAKPGGGLDLKPDHAAIREKRTLFPSTVVDAADSPRLLIDGSNSRKIGKRVTKGRWKGMPIFTLTLEERATCPSSCKEWSTCYGNRMHLARRHRDDGTLTIRLRQELDALDRKHPDGFVVRLHVLGDFGSISYVDFWGRMLERFHSLRIFGFTAHGPEAPIGRALAALNDATDRCRIRFSGYDGPMGSLVVDHAEDAEHVLCPVQTEQTDCCGTCGLCWTMSGPIEFARH